MSTTENPARHDIVQELHFLLAQKRAAAGRLDRKPSNATRDEFQRAYKLWTSKLIAHGGWLLDEIVLLRSEVERLRAVNTELRRLVR